MNPIEDYRMTELNIDNFKVFHDFRITFSDPITAIVGDNASGKSSILQAIAFLKYCCTSTTDSYMKERGANVEDIVSRVMPKMQKIISFNAGFVNRKNPKEHISWYISFVADKTNKKISLRKENISMAGRDKTILYYTHTIGYRWNEKTDEIENIPAGEYLSSHVSFIDEKLSSQFPYLYALKKFFQESETLDLLAPRNMRKSARGQERSLGDGGEKLPNLVYKLNGEEKVQLLTSLQQALPNMSAVRAVRSGSGKAGWAHLEITEKFSEHPVVVQAGGISDGTLRLIALFALPFLKKRGGCILLDEVEDGINANNINDVLDTLRQYAEYSHQQIILTTHSTVLLDYVEPESIRCLYRREDGCAECVDFLNLKDAKEKLSYLYPGEIILNGGKGLFNEQEAQAYD